LVKIIFEAHSTTFDNEAHLASGWNDVDLSPLGIQQSIELGERYKDKKLDAIFCSDLRRSYKTGERAFQNRGIPIIKDQRLRECHYGDMTKQPSVLVDPEKPHRIGTPFPNGESYKQTTARMKYFLEYLLENFDGQTVMIIGHRATQYALENLILKKSLEEVIPVPWQWQPGWLYQLREV
jgi:broad specificity phosphatase PhoE